MKNLLTLLVLCIIALGVVYADESLLGFTPFTQRLFAIEACEEKEIEPKTEIKFDIPSFKDKACWYDFKYVIPEGEPVHNVYAEMMIVSKHDPDAYLLFDPDIYMKIGEPARDVDSADASDTTNRDAHIASYSTSKDLAGKTVYISVSDHNLVGGSITLKMTTYRCGDQDCGGHHGKCNDKAVCECNQYYAGEFCENSLIENAELDADYNRASNVRHYSYLQFANIKIPKNGWMTTHFSRTVADEGFTLLYAKGYLPTVDKYDYKQLVFPTTLEANFQISGAGFGSGTWYLGVLAGGSHNSSFKVHTHIDYCPKGCSNHGTCNKETSTCDCDVNYTTEPDCSRHSRPLFHGEKFDFTLNGYSEAVFNIPVNNKFVDGPVEFKISLDIKDEKVPENTGFPSLYLKYGSNPTDTDFLVESAQPPTKKQVLYIADALLKPGQYRLLIVNDANFDFNAQVFVELIPHCDANCNKKGDCDQHGACQCEKNRIGGDCGIDAAECRRSFKLPGGGVSAGLTVGLMFLFMAIGAGAGVFLFKKYGSRITTEPVNPDSQYSQLE